MPAKKLNNRRINIQDVDGKKRNIYLPVGTSKAGKDKFKSFAKKLILHQKANLDLSDSDIKYLLSLSNEYKEKLKLLGIKFKDDDAGKYALCVVVNEFIEEKTLEDLSYSTQDKYEKVSARLIKFFGKEKDIRDITFADGKKFFRFLVDEEGLAANSSARRSSGYASTIFINARKIGLISINPFDDVDKNAQPNEDKHFYINAEITNKLFDVINNDEDKLRFVLMRFLGLRCPSELNLLKWSDFDFQKGMVTIRSPKLKKTKKYIRRCPFNLPDVLPIVKEAFSKRKTDYENVVAPVANENLRARVEHWCGAAGLKLWPDLLQNFRRSAVTDACETWESHVVAAYFGHDEAISKKHYRLVHDAHAVRATTIAPMIGRGAA